MWKKKVNSVYIIFVLSYISILILTLSSAFVYYAKINKQITMQTELSTVTMLGQLKADIEDDLSYIKDLSNDIVFNNTLEMVAKGVPTYSYTELMKDLSSKQKPRDFLLDYFVYISSTDEIVTPTIKMKAEKFFNLMYEFIDLDYDTFERAYLHGYHFQEFMPIQQMNQYESNMIQVLPYIQSFPINTRTEPLGQVIFFVDANKMLSLVNQLNQVTNSNIYVLDKENNLRLSSNNAPELNRKKLESFNTGSDTREEIIHKVVSEKTGWKFIVSTPKNLYFKENTNYLFTFIAIFLVYLIIGLIIVRFLARRSYKPLKEINDLIMYHPQLSATGGNEYEKIKKTIIDQINNGKELNEVIEKQMPIVRRDYLLHLTRGIMTNYDDVSMQLSSIGIYFSTDTFVVGTLEFDMDSPYFMNLTNVSEKSLSLARIVAENVGCELMMEHFTCYFLDSGRSQCIYLLNLKENYNPAEAVSLAKKQADALIQFAYKHYQLNLNFGISLAYSEIKNLHKCLDESKKALEHSKLRDVYETVCFEDLGDLCFDYYYPMETEQQLVSLLKRGQYEQAQELLETIFEINTTSKNISAGAARLLLYEIASTLIGVNNYFLVAKGNEPLTNEQIVEQMISNSSMDLAKRRFMEMIDRIAEESENRSLGKTEKLVNRITEYIHQHADETWLDLNILSEEFEVTPQYISNVFKKYKHENIKDYISKLKLDKAKVLLATTDLPVREIALQLGYASEGGIIRLFKKFEGITPGDYRISCREEG